VAKKDIIVIGTSAEGLDPLIALAQGLPKTVGSLGDFSNAHSSQW